MGHLALGKRGRGFTLLAITMLLILVLYGRWDAFVNAFRTTAIDHWVAAVFLMGALASGVVYSVWDVHRLLSSPSADHHGKSPFQMARRRFVSNGLAVASLWVIGLLCLVAILAPLLAPYDPAGITDVLETRYLPPSWTHPFGTDAFGRDLLSRALFGGRVSLSVGLLAVLLAMSIGTTYGAVAAYFGGVVDSVLMRIVDVVLAFPVFFLMLMLVGIFEANVIFLVLILGLTSWTGTARFIRGEMLSLKEREFTEAARSIGLPSWRIIVRHQIPNALSPVLVQAALMVGGMIGAEAALSFLGIGIRPPTPSWGNMVSAGKDALLVAWWIAFFPGALLAIVVLSFNLLADGLRDALDPKALMQRFV
jgi:peptide/nickel transport system permease protein